MSKFLRTRNTKIVDGNKAVMLRGTNLGGWLMMEAYFMHSPHIPEHLFKKEFVKKRGKGALKNFEKEFRSNFIREGDIKRIKKIGFNCLRVPFNYRLVESSSYKYNQDGLKYLDQVCQWGKKYKIWMILDLHAAPGAQNHDWHSDSAGKAELWKNKAYRHRTFALWEFLADRYKDEEYLAGYDVLNEAVLNDTNALNRFYKQLIKTIRRVDQNHILFIEGNKWGQDLNCLDIFDDDNHALSIHSYEPLDFTFNFVPELSYPVKSKKLKWNKTVIKKLLKRYDNISKKRNVPIFVGEFGVNYRSGLYNEHLWLRDTLNCFEQFGFHWTYWPWKAIKNYTFPDGIMSYYENPPWVNREGPTTGWHTFKDLWPTQKNAMIKSWRTENFKENTFVLKELRHALRYRAS